MISGLRESCKSEAPAISVYVFFKDIIFWIVHSFYYQIFVSEIDHKRNQSPYQQKQEGLIMNFFMYY
jgi:hypothetical protein